MQKEKKLPSGYPDTYFAATAVGMRDHLALAGTERADVCVIGGGFTGLSAALNLAEQGFDVVLLEGERIGFGASGRCGGLVGSGQRKDVIETEEAFGYERSRQLWDFAELAKNEIRERVTKHAISCDLQNGQLVGVHKKRYQGWPQELSDKLAERYEYPHCKSLNAEQTRALVATDGFLGALYDSQALALHPLNYTLGIANAAANAGVRIFERSRVTSYSRTEPALVETSQGSVKADFVVLACNGYLDKLERRIARKIMPINNFMIATEPLGERRASELINGRFGVHDTRFVVNYFRLSEDHRLLFGGGENYRREFPADISKFVLPYMLKLFPQLDDARINYAWGGTLSVTVNRLPHFGRLEPNVYFAQGYSGHGISTANFAGKVIAEAIGGTATRFDVFAGLPTHIFPGGTLLRYPGMVLAMLYYSLIDRL
ncbi:MAG: FAD-binding oxidoreductase [Gammaproteobacteria bacterium]|nr:FAD-binding oxidoreductase [Gammaproteobacteria bacterium]MDH3363907.1 FAD-binding oxidoreductase [Gammaproteobacteria bacterium]MDH3480991.1 FAD-binding oxidoreductase [Gammaproteobacteria bacterium]